MPINTFDCIVVGKGLLGSSAVKYLCKELNKVAIIGPDEPIDIKTHKGVFASHYDSGRITRILDGDRSCLWANVAKASINRYAEIEKESGINFFNPVGCIKIAPNDSAGVEYIESHKFVGDRMGVNYTSLDADSLIKKYPFLSFPRDSICLLENDSAGWINPRAFIQAQLKIAKSNGAVIVNDTVCNITCTSNGGHGKEVNDSNNTLFQITSAKGQLFEAKKVLIAAGAFSNFNNLTPAKLAISIRGESIALGELSNNSAQQLKSMPSIIWPIHRKNILSHVYIVPVVNYPDGKNYIKVGAKSKQPLNFNSLNEVEQWFHSDGIKSFNKELVSVMTELMPTTEFLSWQFKPCIITDTADTRPLIEPVSKDLYVATGGNGYGAKSSDELGKLAANLCTGNEIDYFVSRYFSGSASNDSLQ